MIREKYFSCIPSRNLGSLFSGPKRERWERVGERPFQLSQLSPLTFAPLDLINTRQNIILFLAITSS